MIWGETRWLLLAALALAAVPAALLAGRWRHLQMVRLASPRVWGLWLGGVPATGALRLTLWLLAAAAAAVAAARPQWGVAAVPTPTADVAVALDVSGSMAATDEPPSRLAKATAVLRSLAEELPEARWSLTVGAERAFTLVPLTGDRQVVQAALADPALAQRAQGGSNLAVLLASAAGTLPAEGPGRVVVLASDGEQTDGDATSVAESLRARGIGVVALMSGTPAGSPVPQVENGSLSYLRDRSGRLVHSRAHPELLHRLASGPAAFVRAGDSAAARRLAAQIVDFEERSSRPALHEHTAAFILLAAGLVSVSFLLWPWRRLATAAGLAGAFAVAAPFPGRAATPTDLPRPEAWQRLLPGSPFLLAERGAHALARGEFAAARSAYAKALALAPNDSRLRLGWASAAAMLGALDGEGALAELAKQPGTAFIASYDLGTARLARGDAAGALAPLLRAVALRPGSREAWHNLQLARLRVDRTRNGASGAGDASRSMDEELLRAAAERALLVPGPPIPAPVSTGGPTW